MALKDGRHYQSRIIGDLKLPESEPATSGARRPAEPPVAVLFELNVLYPGGLPAATEAFIAHWRAHGPKPRARRGAAAPAAVPGAEPLPAGLQRVTSKLLQGVLTRRQLQTLVSTDAPSAADPDRVPTIFKAWPDYVLDAQIDRSAPTVKADAGWRSYNALGHGVVWAVIDSGIDGKHPHFSSLELAKESGAVRGKPVHTAGLHRDFTGLVQLPGNVPADPSSPLTDEFGHGTHVAGIIAGATPAGATAHVAASVEPTDSGYVQRGRVGELSGMAPQCELVSLKVIRRDALGSHITSSSAVIAALDYIRTQVNVDPGLLRIHGVNLSLGCQWDPSHYAAGQSPLSQAVNQLVQSGVVVVISSGNGGHSMTQDSTSTQALLGSITEPAHAEQCIAVGSTHREAPHTFGISWTSGKGPTLDGRSKPDVVAPGEWISSAATGLLRTSAGLDGLTGKDRLLTYAEQSGTSMAAPHVSGVIAAFLSARPEYIGKPWAVKDMVTRNATDLGRERYAQGAGLVDLMRMLSNA